MNSPGASPNSYDPQETDLQDGGLENVSHILPAAVLHALHQHRDALVQRDLFPLNKDGQPMDMAELATLIVNDFVRLQDQERQGVAKQTIESTIAYGDAVSWLALIGVVSPNLAGDWEVGRTDAAENSLGIRDWDVWETTFTELYPSTQKRIHLEMGPGSGKAMQQRRLKNLQKPPEKRVEQYGLADKIWYSVENVVKNFIKPELREDPVVDRFIEFLGFALRLELKSLWFEADGNVIGTWRSKVDIFDLNQIYALLRNPKQWLHNWYNPLTGVHKVSVDFENESEARLDPDVHRLFLEFEGVPDFEIEDILHNVQFAELNREHDKTSERVRNLRNDIAALRRRDFAHLLTESSIASWYEAIKKRVLIADIKAMEAQEDFVEPQTVEALIAYAEKLEQKYVGKLGEIKNEENALLYLQKSPREPAPRPDFLRAIFSEEFVRAVENSAAVSPERAMPDLNRSCSVNLNNVVIDDFLQVAKHFPPRSLFTVSGVRSLSHLPDALYEKVIRLILPLLADGAHILDDGLRASYSRIYRFDIIQKIVAENPEYKAYVIVDQETNEPKSVFIQRAHDKGFAPDILDEEGRKRLLGENRVFQPIDKVAARPHLRVLNGARKAVLGMAQGNVNVFKGLHEKVNGAVARVLSPDGVQKIEGSLGFPFHPGMMPNLDESALANHTAQVVGWVRRRIRQKPAA